MDARTLSRGSTLPRSGFTWVELIVCFAIIGLLVALLLPAVRNTKPIARRTQCQSNLRNVGIAFHAYATTRRGELPPLTGGFLIANPHIDKRAELEIEAPWSVTILPYLEQTKLYDRLRITDDNPLQWQRGTTGGIGADEAQLLAQTAISTYLCPDTQNQHAGGLSYVANAGIIPEDSWSTADLDTDHSADRLDFGFNGYGAENHNTNDAELAYATGVFWHVPVGTPTDKKTPTPINLDQIAAHDGTSQTILLAENLHTRSYDPQSRTGGWISNATGDIAFGIAVPGTRDGTAFRVALSDTAGGLGLAGGVKETALALSKEPVPPHCRINANLKDAVNGRAPRPSSNHRGVVNMAFADGSCKTISEQIDPSVYARLLSPMGGRYGQTELSDNDF